MTCGPGKDQYLLLDGCSGNNQLKRPKPLHSQYGPQSMAFHDEIAGEAVCCNDHGESTRNVVFGEHALWNNAKGQRILSHENCTTPSTERVFAGKGEPSWTFDEAKDICEGVGLRLCRSQAELDTSCETGCGFNNALVWVDDSKAKKHHDLLDSCSTNGDLFEGWGQPRPAVSAETLGEAVCCNEEGLATRN